MPKNMASLRLDDSADNTVVEDLDRKPRFPFGTTLTLDKVTLAKLGIVEMPQVGSELSIQGKAEVVAVRQEEGEPSDDRSVELQLTDLSVGGELPQDTSDAGRVMFGDSAAFS